MKTRFGLFCATLVCLMLAVGTLRGFGADSKGGPDGDPKTVALIMKTLTNPFFIEMEKGARRAEKELGVRLLVKTGAKETSIDQQIAIVEDMIRQHIDAIVIAPGSSTELIPVLKKAQNAGIRIVNIDNRLDPGLSAKIGLIDVPFISVDNIQGAYLATRVIIQKVHPPATAAIIEGIRAATNAANRKQGALKAFEENPGIRVVAMETANWKIDEAFTVASRIFAAHPEVTLLFCANDMMALALTGNAFREDAEKCLAIGCDTHLSKPIRKEKLLTTMIQFLEVFSNQKAPPVPDQETPDAGFEFYSLTEAEKDIEDIITVTVDSDLEALIPDFLQSIRDQTLRLSGLLRENNYADIRKIGHSLKGVGGGYGFQRITELGAQIEQAARSGRQDGIELGIADLRDYLARVQIITRRV